MKVFPTRKHRDDSEPEPFLPVNRGIVMEWLELTESVESPICLHYAGPKCGLAGDQGRRPGRTRNGAWDDKKRRQGAW